ncbi:Glutaredoxin-like protein [Hapsidospora chrysogenum ATCC 11550]|uniref:Glutaredoxin-like protein n=1 Tax=Hapsidospora chrysogenum (strain ATCC 11550 / CBS 779.69 / DSM 880 / IAM 14645 / JCM 23072 / IMI 49137) TaxID=857340 RepID=A0A086T562_HAPC1|nr:Glutaredoxin-like protein [Hapsidospora chrysogenum ATCC 11550]
MFATRRLLQACRITLFTRPGCGLCDQGKQSLSKVWDKRPFAYHEENVDAKGSKWRDLYDFDVPVIHISKADSPSEDVTTASKAVKLMHRFTPEQVEAKMDEVEAR